MTHKIVSLKNVDITIINNLLLQSLEVSPQLMFEFSPTILKSVNFSSTKTFIKFWTIEISKLIKSIEKEPIEDLDLNDVMNIDSSSNDLSNFNETFNFYLLKGDLLKSFLSVFKNDLIDIDFTLINGQDGKLQAQSITVKGLTESDKNLIAKLDLTTDDMITDKVSDYAQLLEICKPKSNMSEIVLTNNNLKELRRIISNMNKTISNNSSFVTFTIEDDLLKVNDKVFDITFDDLQITSQDNFSFNILKNDFKLIGNHSFKIFTGKDDKDIHFGAKFGNAIIWCLTSKPKNSEELMNETSEDILSSDDINDYGLEDLNLEDY